jgi:hypothetical protein
MPVNYQQIQDQAARFYDRAAEYHRAVDTVTSLLLSVLNQFDKHTDQLRHSVEAEVLVNKSLRCAKPTGDSLTGVFHLPQTAEPVQIIAADGSQVNPSRHRQVDFGIINVATINMHPGTGAAPDVTTQSFLLDDFDLHPGNASLTEELINLERDIREHSALLDQARKYPSPVIALTDGPLELFRETGTTVWFDKKMKEYLQILDESQKSSITTAGYVDKPHSDLVIRLVKLAMEKVPSSGAPLPDELENIRIPDARLYENLLSEPGDRSEVFAIQSQWNKYFKDNLELCFFYLNVNRAGKPWLVRVEIPAWCAGAPRLMDNLHAAIFRQCEIMGSRPYPYVLHRAHELALVTHEETSQLENMLSAGLQTRGLDAGVKSNKQSAKDLPGRGRYP